MYKFARYTSVLAMALVLWVTGCTSTEQPPPLQAEGGNLQVVTSFGPNDGGHQAFISLCSEFSEANGIEIIDNSADSTEEWKESVIASFDDGSEPDVLFFFTGADVEKLIQKNQLTPLDEICESYYDYASNINLSVLESMKATDGKNYAVPVKGYWERLFVNTDIFNELNVPLPEEYGDVFEIAPQLIEAGYIPIAASLREVPHYLFEAFLFNETGPANHHHIPSDPDNLPPSWISALEQFPAMYKAGMFPDDEDAVTHAEAFALFQAKKAAMIVDGDWSVAYVNDTENTAVINFPAWPEGMRKNSDLISGFSMGFYITRKAWDDPVKRDAAVRFVQFITSNDSIERLNVSGAAMPISLSGGNAAQAGQESDGLTPLRRSVDLVNKETTAFVGAVADTMTPKVRTWLFSQILPLAKGEKEVSELLREFILLHNENR